MRQTQILRGKSLRKNKNLKFIFELETIFSKSNTNKQWHA